MYSSAHFGRQDPTSWVSSFLKVAAASDLYRQGVNPKNGPKFTRKLDEHLYMLRGLPVSVAIGRIKESLVRLVVVKHMLSMFKPNIGVLIHLLAHHHKGISQLDGNADLDLNSDEAKKFYIANMSFKVKVYTTLDIAYFCKNRDVIKTMHKMLDQQCMDLNDPSISDLVLDGFVPASTSNSTDSPASASRKRRRITLPSTSVRGNRLGAMKSVMEDGGRL